MKTKSRIEFEKIQEQIIGLHDEVDKLSKKKPDDAINIFKLRFINEILNKANSILDRQYLPFEEFKIFDEQAIPSNSDVVLILSQYIKAFGREFADKEMWMWPHE